ncbi:LOW QUALITY PROTEIN: F-box protein At1g22220-like [Durio zibethinus]|uniref:LOW QUALITY PROTEIN: F-box protein At1g22220-like n=1 Tax=Durio zibethinus TaxID=66656 RepID=A0A6P6B7X2_DURZI|nr:LOW QUALITY PROTEIN: F-box protein At1g22220-like [Durio zibethinus]
MDGFDRLPDSLILLIFNSVADVKTLIRCLSVSKRFNSLVPQAESLLLKIDRVISSESDSDSLFLTLLKPFLCLILPKPTLGQLRNQTHTYPVQILSRFQRIRELHVELPAGDLHLEKGTVVKWRAEFGETLKSCVILGFRLGNNNNGNYEAEFGGGLKTRVMWTISALIAASVRHFLLREVVKDHDGMEELVLTDREGEGVVMVEQQGLREWRKARGSCRMEERRRRRRGRTVVPSVRIRMRHEPRMGATLVVVRAVEDGEQTGREADMEDAELALKAFGNGVYGDAVRELLKVRSYLLETNSF